MKTKIQAENFYDNVHIKNEDDKRNFASESSKKIMASPENTENSCQSNQSSKGKNNNKLVLMVLPLLISMWKETSKILCSLLCIKAKGVKRHGIWNPN